MGSIEIFLMTVSVFLRSDRIPKLSNAEMLRLKSLFEGKTF